MAENELTINGLIEAAFDDIVAVNVTVENDLTVIGDTINSGNQIITGTLGVVGTINSNTGYLLNGLPLDTLDITEAAPNLYFTTARARSAFSSSTNVIYDVNNGTFDVKINSPIDVPPDDLGPWINANYGVGGDYGIGQWSMGRMRLYMPAIFGTVGFSTKNSSNVITDLFTVGYNGDSNLYGSLTVQSDLSATHITATDWISASNYISTPQYKVSGVNLNTSHVPETAGALYFTTARARNSLSSGGNGITYDAASGQISWTGSTLNVNEDPSNLYFTDTRARTATNIDLSVANTTIMSGGTEYNLNIKGTNTSGLTSRLRFLDGNNFGHSIVNDATNQRLNFFTFYPSGTPVVKFYIGTSEVVSEVNFKSNGLINAVSGYQVNGVALNTSHVAEAGTNYYYTDTRFTNSLSSLAGIVYNGSKELGLGGLSPLAGYALYMEKPMYIKRANGDCLFLEGTDLFNGNPSTIQFKSGTTMDYIQHVDTAGGQFIISKPLTVAGKIYTSGALEVDGAAQFDSTSIHTGLATFNGGLNSNSGIRITTGDPNKMLYTQYNSIRDIYGFGQYSGGTTRMFSATTATTFWSSCNLSSIIDNSTNLYVDHLRTQSGKVGILAFQDITPDQVNTLISPLRWTAPQISTSQFDGALKIQLQRNGDTTYFDTRTFTTITQNVGIIEANKTESNVWIQGIRSLQNGGDSEVEYYETKLATYNNPSTSITDPNYNLDNKAQFRINGYATALGTERQLMALYYHNAEFLGNGGYNASNVRFPQLARASFINAYFDPYGFIFPDVYASDKRLKKNIVAQEKPILEEFLKINVVNFNWDYKGEHADYCSQQPRTITDEVQIGIIAQNLEELPTIKEHFKIVETYQFSSELPTGTNPTPWDKKNFKPEKEFLILNKERIPFLNMKAIQEVSAKVNKLEDQVESLGGVDLEDLRAENEALKNKVVELEQTLEGLILVLKKKFII